MPLEHGALELANAWRYPSPTAMHAGQRGIRWLANNHRHIGTPSLLLLGANIEAEGAGCFRTSRASAFGF